jgi:hypothetical protein
MRKLIVAMAVTGALVLGQAAPGRAVSGAEEAGLALGSAGINLFYVPVKGALAVAGLAVGAVTGLLAGGDVRAAYALWVPTAGGTFLVTPAHLDGTRRFEFFGSDYADRPTARGPYEAM